MPKHLIKLTATWILIASLSACSGGSTSNGLGLGIGGTWFGSLSRNNVVVATFSLSLAQVADDTADPFSSSTLSGVFNSSDRCIGGGQVEGTLGANSINISVDSNNGELNMSGTTSNSAMRGTWSNAGEFTIESDSVEETSSETTTNNDDNSSTTTTTTSTPGTTTETITCNFGGSWSAHR